MLARFILVVLVLATFGCSSATYIRAKATENPLDRVAQQAQAAQERRLDPHAAGEAGTGHGPP